MIFICKIFNATHTDVAIALCFGIKDWKAYTYDYTYTEVFDPIYEEVDIFKQILQKIDIKESDTIVLVSQRDVGNKVYSFLNEKHQVIKLDNYTVRDVNIVGYGINSEDAKKNVELMHNADSIYTILALLHRNLGEKRVEIKQLEFNSLLENHKKNIALFDDENTLNRWVEYKTSKLLHSELAYISLTDFNLIETEFSFKFPDNIKYFYSQIGAKESDDLVRTLIRILKKEREPEFCFHYSENFASEIISSYLCLTPEERVRVNKEVSSFKQREGCSSDLEFLLLEVNSFFDIKEDKFTIPFIQRLFLKLRTSANNLLTHTFITWYHCGGFGGIVLNTNKKGCEGVFQHYDFSEVIKEGIRYEYNGNILTFASDVNKEHIKKELLLLKTFHDNYSRAKNFK